MLPSVDQILALAPDAAAAAAGRKLAVPGNWQGLGLSERALWGECQGSALYQVRVDLGDLASKCTCPSRKFPCKHALGLLLFAATTPVPQSVQPDWVSEWLEKRGESLTRKEKRTESVPDPEAQAKRAQRRSERVQAGVESLQLWLGDIAREGLASLEARPESFFEQAAARLVDAQASGLANRVRRVAERVGAGREWPRSVLDELGLLALLAHAYRRLESLPPKLQADVRNLVGYSLEKEEVVRDGELLDDEWRVIAQQTFDDERLRMQRNWLQGRASGRRALVLQFAAGRAQFPEQLMPGARLEAKLAFWPSAHPQRALVHERRKTQAQVAERLPGFPRLAALLDDFAGALAQQPWLDRTGAVLHDVTPLLEGEKFRLRDLDGETVELGAADHWKLLALSGGAPLDVAGEWDGLRFWPLHAAAGAELHALRESR